MSEKKHVCLYYESWECPVLKKLDSTLEDFKNGSLEEQKIFVEICKGCPHKNRPRQ